MVRIAVASAIALSVLFLAVFSYYYVKYDRIIDRRMRGQIFNTSAKIYARPRVVRIGDRIGVEQIATELRRAGYVDRSTGIDSQMGTFKTGRGAIEIYPGPESYHSPDGAVIRTGGGSQIEAITSANGEPLDGYELEPQLVTALFEGQDRTKRQIVRFEDLPKVMVDAVLAIEDRRFFQHSGVNYFRLAKAAYIDITRGGKEQGGSTLTMQIARGFFLSPEKKIKRKLTEMLIAIELEQKFTKQQIFELYANQIYMGQRGSFSIHGLAEASRSYFGKDIKSLTLPEAATLAGMIQSPNILNPYKRPDRVTERRNVVLESMVETGTITREECDRAKATGLKLAPPNVEASDAPYFVDLVKDTLNGRYSERDLNENAYRIYTTIDPELQHAAAEAVQVGMDLVDEQVRKQRLRRKKVGKGKNAKVEQVEAPGPVPQVALVALDPHTGDVLALVGGRNYGFSQLNHATAKRPTGSIFKPFVFAAALNTSIGDATENAFTPASLIDDSPTTFVYGDQVYEPRNYQNEYHGQVTARFAMQKSLNNATVKLAETVGYDKVVELARAAGITSVKATPAMALGAYDASPLEMAGAYTVFANSGTRVDPIMVRSVRTAQGEVVEDFRNGTRPVLDPRVTYVLTNMMQAVVNHGTGYNVRARGFNAPAAGKTGTSHDAWFAGYTTNLLCIVWVGYDDYSDLKLSGGTTAAPIWAEFMKRAVALPQYKSPGDFPQPSGVVDVQLDKATNLLATASCPDDYNAAFIAGTEPKMTCDQANPNFFQRILGMGPSAPVPPVINGPAQVIPPGARPAAQSASAPGEPVPAPGQPAPEKKKGFWGKFIGALKGESGDEKPEQQKANNPPPP